MRSLDLVVSLAIASATEPGPSFRIPLNAKHWAIPRDLGAQVALWLSRVVVPVGEVKVASIFPLPHQAVPEPTDPLVGVRRECVHELLLSGIVDRNQVRFKCVAPFVGVIPTQMRP